MKTLILFLLTATVAFAQTSTALKDGSNVDPATWRSVLDVPQTSALSLSQNKLAGRGASSGTGSIQEITLGTNLSLSGTTLNAEGGTVDNAAVNSAIADDASELYRIAISDVVYTAVTPGPSGANITVAHVISGSGSTVVSVSVVGNAITVTAGSAATSVTVAAAVNANGPAAALVTASAYNGSTRAFDDKTATNLEPPNVKTLGNSSVPQYDSNGYLWTGLTNNSPGGLRVPAGQKINFNNEDGTIGARIYPFGNHGQAYSSTPVNELIYESPRHGFYWNDGMQIGNADAARGSRYIYIRNNGTATAGSGPGDSLNRIHESNPITFVGSYWNGSAAAFSSLGMQWVPSGALQGELQFWTTEFEYPQQTTGSFGGNTQGEKVFSIADTGPVVGTNQLLTFGDSTTLSSTDDIVTIVEANIPATRTGFTTLVAGEATVTDASITGYTEIIVSHKEAGGTLGHLSTVKDYGIGFDIVSTSATDTSTVSYLLVEGETSDIAAPVISGTSEIGDTLTVTGGTGGRQWKANGSNITGETAATYVIGADYIGQDITCAVGGVASNSITAWHPDDESGYFADYRANTGLYQTNGGSAATAHNDPVGVWQDQSGNARHLLQETSGYRPLLDLTTSASYPHLVFDGTDDRLAVNVTLTLPQTAFIVGETVTVAANRRLFSTDAAGERMLIEPQGGSEIKNGNAAPATTNTDDWPINTKKIVMAQTVSNEHRIRVDGGTQFTSSANTPATGSALSLGGLNLAGHHCRVYGMLFYTAELDSSAQARVRKYLKAKYGTP